MYWQSNRERGDEMNIRSKIRDAAIAVAVIPPVIVLAAFGGAAIGLAMGAGAAFDILSELWRPRATINAYPD